MLVRIGKVGLRSLCNSSRLVDRLGLFSGYVMFRVRVVVEFILWVCVRLEVGRLGFRCVMC